MQRTERATLAAPSVERARLCDDVLAIEMHEGVDFAVDGVDAVETGAGVVLGRERAPGHLGSGLARGQCREPLGAAQAAGLVALSAVDQLP